MLTIHNLAYQGLFPRDALPRLGVPDSAFQVDGAEFYGQLSFLKAGIFYASQVTTVSETYAREIQTPELGCGLDGLLRTRAGQGRLAGILNGIDETWDPSTDPHLATRFEVDDWKGKRANAEAVRRQFGLAVSRGPLFAIVSRLVHQKGIDLSLQAAESIVAGGGQLVVIGQGEGRFEQALQGLARRHPDAVGVHVGFEEAQARRMFAGSDFLLMPSRFEPCGLAQMYAQRFGSLPIVRRTGGLADTVEDGVTGFTFAEPSASSFGAAVRRALEAFGQKKRLNAMRRRAMSARFGWDQAADNYAGSTAGRSATASGCAGGWRRDFSADLFPGACSVSGMRPGSQHKTSRSDRLDQPVPLARRFVCWIPDQVPLALHLSGKGRASCGRGVADPTQSARPSGFKDLRRWPS